jgi:hypothetical protein
MCVSRKAREREREREGGGHREREREPGEDNIPGRLFRRHAGVPIVG